MSAPVIISRPHKSIVLSILLTLLLGPIGLFYASITGGLIMTLGGPVLIFLLFMLGLLQDNVTLLGLSFGLLLFFALTYWLINLIWAITAVLDYNSRVDEDAKRELDMWSRIYSKEQSPVVVNIAQSQGGHGTDPSGAFHVSHKPPLQEWLRTNPGKSINDYFAKFGR